MKLKLPFPFLVSFLIVIAVLISCQNILADTAYSENDQVVTQPVEDFFIPIDSLPNFIDFKTIAWQYIDGFDKILPSFPKCSFYTVPNNAGKALSDHLVTWSEFAQCLNSAVTRYSASHSSTTAHNLWTVEMEPYITRRVVSCPILGSSFSTKAFSYDVVPEHASEAAMLPAATAQRYVNWRSLHYWLYRQLKREEAFLNGQQIKQESDDKLTTYFRNKTIYPPIDIIQNIDHTDEILKQSTEVGCYWFSENGNKVKSIDPTAPFSLPTIAQKTSWDDQYAGQFPLQETIWTSDSVNDRTDPTDKRAIQLAVNKDIMMQESKEAVEEALIQYRFQEIQQNIILLKSTKEYSESSQNEQAKLENIFWNVTGCLGIVIAGSEIKFLLEFSDTLLSLSEFSNTTPALAIESLITNGEFSDEDCVAANEILATYKEGENVQLTQEQIQSIVSRKNTATYCDRDISQLDSGIRIPHLTEAQYRALVEAYKNKFGAGKVFKVLGALDLSLFSFYFGNASNIDCTY